jgi:nucleotide-binding universal stress UspA family protein
MYDRILVPLDGSDLAEAALPFVELIPSRHVRLLAVEPVVLAAPRRRAAFEPPLPSGAGRVFTPAAYLDSVGEPFRRQGRDVELVVESGDPGARIVVTAADASLIVMATRGRGAVGRALLGSVADHVARHAPAPTLLVRGTDPRAAPMVGRVVIPLDGSERAEAALPVAARWGGDLGVRPHLVRVVDTSTQLTTEEEARREAAAYLDEQARRLSVYDAVATSEVLTGPTVRALLEAIGPADLVVMTTRGRGGLGRALLGSVAERLVREAAGPVLLVR